MSQKTFSLTVGVIFLVIAVLHALRLSLGWLVLFEDWFVPTWVSWVALVVALFLSRQGFKNAK